jgi:antitoxin YefM
MGHVSDVEFNENVIRYLDAAADEPVVVEREHGRPSLVVMALSEFESRKETAYLLASPANAERLLESARRINASWQTAETGDATHAAH